MSDSEGNGDSENFESADENLSGSDCSDERKSESPPTPERSKTAQYRKRPERTTSGTLGSGAGKSKNEKTTDLAKPEVFLKDVASHISKNIDRSLDGILKTSSSIKDVVFGAFPSSEIESEKEKLNLFDEPESNFNVEISAKSNGPPSQAFGEKSLLEAEEDLGNESKSESAGGVRIEKGCNTEVAQGNSTVAEKVLLQSKTVQEPQPEPEPVIEKPKLEPKPESVLESTEGWDDFDFDEDEAVVLDSTVKNASIEPSHKEKTNDYKSFATEKDSWGLGGWGVGSLLDTATAVTRGLSTVLETGLGVPDPETLAAASKSEGVAVEREATDDPSWFPNFGITSLVAGVQRTKVQTIGAQVISGGLDTLENIGKKTMQVLQEGDPGLKKKRALLLGNDKPVLSRVLREAKEKAEKEDKVLAEKETRRYCRFETLFDDFQGLVHLEALEMLSRLCEYKLEQLRAGCTDQEKRDLEGILEQVKELCDIQESDLSPNFSDVTRLKIVLAEAAEPLANEISTARIVEIHQEAIEWLAKYEKENGARKVIYRKAMSTIAELTAATAHQFHKAGELLAVKERRKTVEEAEAFMQLTSILCSQVDVLSNMFSERLRKQAQDEDDAFDLNEKNIRRESENAISYIKQAFNLLIPVLQLGAT